MANTEFVAIFSLSLNSDRYRVTRPLLLGVYRPHVYKVYLLVSIHSKPHVFPVFIHSTQDVYMHVYM